MLTLNCRGREPFVFQQTRFETESVQINTQKFEIHARSHAVNIRKSVSDGGRVNLPLKFGWNLSGCCRARVRQYPAERGIFTSFASNWLLSVPQNLGMNVESSKNCAKTTGAPSRIATIPAETQGIKRRFVDRDNDGLKDGGESGSCKAIKRPRLRAIEKVIEESHSDTATKLKRPYRIRLTKMRVMLDNGVGGCYDQMNHRPLESRWRGKACLVHPHTRPKGNLGTPGSLAGFRKGEGSSL